MKGVNLSTFLRHSTIRCGSWRAGNSGGSEKKNGQLVVKKEVKGEIEAIGGVSWRYRSRRYDRRHASREVEWGRGSDQWVGDNSVGKRRVSEKFEGFQEEKAVSKTHQMLSGYLHRWRVGGTIGDRITVGY